MSAYFQPGILAVRTYYRAILLFPLAAVLLVFFYYQHPAFQAWCARLAAWKNSGGLLLVCLSSIIVGLLLPELAKFATRQWQAGHRYLHRMAFAAAFFALTGIIVDLFYSFQALWLGDSSSWKIVVIKVLFDQFVFTPFFTIPLAVVWFLWGEEKLNIRRTWKRLRPALIGERVLPILLPAWLFWIPMVSCVYAMPANLQFLLYLCANGAWGLVFLAISRQLTEISQQRQ